MKKVITYGTYDLLHRGHIALLERAKALGDYLIVGVTSDAFDRNRGKLNVRQSLVERIKNVEKTGLADEIIVEEYEGQKLSDIKKYNIDVFALGSDWQGKCDYLSEYCKVVYLSRTQGISSTQLRSDLNPNLRLGIWGNNNPAKRVIDETNYVSGIDVSGIYLDGLENDDNNMELETFHDKTELFQKSDVIYIINDVEERFHCIMECLEAGKDVMCESPAFLTMNEAEATYKLAHEKGLVFFEAIKTMFFPAFQHLQLIVNSGAIGAIQDVDVSCSQIPHNFNEIKNNHMHGTLFGWGNVVTMPIFKFLGSNYDYCKLYNNEKDGFSHFIRGMVKYPNATASFKVGSGIKTEGNMIITGSKGYVYVPAPWWKPDYFEIRFEDLRATRKYFFQYEGEGFRYEILEFVRMVNDRNHESYKISEKEVLAETRIMEQFSTGDYEKL